MKFTTPLFVYEKPDIADFAHIKKNFWRNVIFKTTLKIYHRTLLSEAQNHKCCWCGILTTEERNKKNSSTIEHVECLSCGGADEPENFAMACARCNHNRQSTPVEEFMNRCNIKIDTSMSGKKNKKKRQRIRAFENMNPEIIWC